MDFSITWLIIVLILLIIEMRLASKWSPFYFKRGIQIYGKENYYVNSDKSLEQISNLLNNAFKGKGFSPSIHFNPIDNKTVAFREKIFELSLFSYTPLMHGTIEINSNKVQVGV